jgi:hypothetical protein
MVCRFRPPRLGFAGQVLALAVAAGTMLAGAAPARADSMDPATERLVLQPNFKKLGSSFTGTCQQLAANPSLLNNTKLFPAGSAANASAFACQPNNVAFDNLLTEYAFAIAPNAFHPARTTGFGGFAFTFEASYTKINPNQTDSSGVAYWQQGTQGPPNPNTNQASIKNTQPDSLISVYSLKARKGFPFGFEITGDVGYIPDTTLWVAGADVRWSLLEGFRTGFLGYIPDVSAGGGVRTMAGTSEFDLTTVGIDVQVSKGIALADSAILTPYVGYQRVYNFGDSQSVSFTPNINPLTACGYTGNSSTGNPMCRHGGDSNFAFNEDSVFANVRNHRDRGIIGLNYRYEVLYLAGQFLVDLVDPSSEDPLLAGSRQWTLSFEGGVYF